MPVLLAHRSSCNTSVILLSCCSQITILYFCQMLLIPKMHIFASYAIKFQPVSAALVPGQSNSPLVGLCSLWRLIRNGVSEALPVLCKPGPGSLRICTFLQEKQWHVLAFRDSKARLHENHFVWTNISFWFVPKQNALWLAQTQGVFLLDLNGFATSKLPDAGQSQLLFVRHKGYPSYKRSRCLLEANSTLDLLLLYFIMIYIAPDV